MKLLHSYIAILLTSLCACNSVSRNKPEPQIYPSEIFLRDAADSSLSTQQILEKFLPGILALAKADTATLFYGSDEVTDDSTFRQLLVGKPFDKEHIVAIELGIRDCSISFYLLDHDTWRRIGREHLSPLTCTVSFMDLDGNGTDEVVTSTCNNMNGNSWKDIYLFSDSTKTVHYAGSFSTDYEVRKDKKQIEETYEGSWYADRSKTLYEWRSEKLVPVKRIILAHDEIANQKYRVFLEYYEAGTNASDTLELKLRELYRETRKQKDTWDNFFK